VARIVSEGIAEWVPVHTGAHLEQVQELALVLAALDIDYWLGPDPAASPPAFVLLVPAPAAGRAQRHLAEYLEQNRQGPPPERPAAYGAVRLWDPAGFWVVLLAVNLCQQQAAGGRDWFGAGCAQAALICSGQWWRAVTALTLHADGPHLYSNLLFGTLFGYLLSHELGPGVAWLMVLLAGAAGNALNACLQAPGHTSVGASTAVFAAIGATVVLQWPHHAGRGRLLRRAAPLVIGVAFLGLLGVSGERTDVLAHVCGLAVGAACGAGLVRARGWLPDRHGAQGWLQALAGLLVVVAWWLAFEQPPAGYMSR
jgi:membrane associated rhomboid family serine protease